MILLEGSETCVTLTQRQTASCMLLTSERCEDCYLPLLLPGAVALIVHLCAHTHGNVNQVASFLVHRQRR